MQSLVRLFFLAATLIASGLCAQDSLPDTGDSPEAWKLLLDNAQEQDNEVLLYLSVPQSKLCEDFEAQTLSNPIVIQYIKRFTNWAHFNSESSLLGEGFTQRYTVDTWPSVLVLNSKGKEIGRITGNSNPAAFIKELNNIRIRHRAPDQKALSESPIRVGFIDTARVQQDSQLINYFQLDLSKLQDHITGDVQEELELMQEEWNRYQSIIKSGSSWQGPIPQDPARISIQEEVKRAFSKASTELSIKYDRWVGEASYPLIDDKNLPLVVGSKILLQGDPLSVELVDITGDVIPLIDEFLKQDQGEHHVQAPSPSASTSYILSFSGKQTAQEWLNLLEDYALLRAHNGEDINTVLSQIQASYSLALKACLPRIRELSRVNLVFDEDGSTYFVDDDVQNADDTIVALLMETAAEFPVVP